MAQRRVRNGLGAIEQAMHNFSPNDPEYPQGFVKGKNR